MTCDDTVNEMAIRLQESKNNTNNSRTSRIPCNLIWLNLNVCKFQKLKMMAFKNSDRNLNVSRFFYNTQEVCSSTITRNLPVPYKKYKIIAFKKNN